MKAWYNGKMIDIEIGQRVFIAKFTHTNSKFGEYATLDRVTKQHLVFVTDTGSILKTKIDNIHSVVGNAAKAEYYVIVNPAIENAIIEKVQYWNKKTCEFVTK